MGLFEWLRIACGGIRLPRRRARAFVARETSVAAGGAIGAVEVLLYMTWPDSIFMVYSRIFPTSPFGNVARGTNF